MQQRMKSFFFRFQIWRISDDLIVCSLGLVFGALTTSNTTAKIDRITKFQTHLFLQVSLFKLELEFEYTRIGSVFRVWSRGMFL